MIKIKLQPDNKTLEYDPTDKKNMLEFFLENKFHLDHACGGNAACSTCHIKITSGMENFNEIDDIEEDLIDFAEDADLNSRLACQCILNESTKSDIEIEIPEQKGLH
jgi:2Fe-2S ferredoxin